MARKLLTKTLGLEMKRITLTHQVERRLLAIWRLANYLNTKRLFDCEKKVRNQYYLELRQYKESVSERYGAA